MYFSNKGKQNTKDTLALALNKAREEKIKNIVIASCTGFTCDMIENVD